MPTPVEWCFGYVVFSINYVTPKRAHYHVLTRTLAPLSVTDHGTNSRPTGVRYRWVILFPFYAKMYESVARFQNIFWTETSVRWIWSEKRRQRPFSDWKSPLIDASIQISSVPLERHSYITLETVATLQFPTPTSQKTQWRREEWGRGRAAFERRKFGILTFVC